VDVRIENTWKSALAAEFGKPYFEQLVRFLHAEKAAGKVIYPPGGLIFRAFELTPVPDVKVVILGQDPYHNPGEAMGLSFSVPQGVRTPPSLRNIFREVETDQGIRLSGCPNLEGWARQGVLLLNSILTVEGGFAASHRGKGWETFTDAVISYLSAHRDGIVFLLWGNYAKAKASLIDTSRHHVLLAAHPSPLAGGAFFGCRHFSRANEILLAEGKTPINWQI